MRWVDWEDMAAVEEVGRKVLGAFDANRSILRNALDDVVRRPELLAMCEHPDPEATADQGQQFDKIVLYSDKESGVRVRMHVFWDDCSYDLPHNHRYSFVSVILKGQFHHSLFGGAGPDDAVTPAPLRPLLVRREQPGSIYALHHDMLHATVAEPQSVTVVVRGPASKDRSFIVDPATDKRVWFVGAGAESPEAVERKRMSPALLSSLATSLSTWGVF